MTALVTGAAASLSAAHHGGVMATSEIVVGIAGVSRGRSNSFAKLGGGWHGQPVIVRPTLFLTVGLPGAGKTTLARQLADELRILRLTPDEWMAPLFGDSEADGRRDILEGRMIWTAREVLRSGVSVILDFGCWSSDERYAIRAIVESADARFELRYVSIDEPERRARASRRWLEHPESTFPMTDADHDRFMALCQPPTAEELAYGPLPAPPSGVESWAHWASVRWPTLPRLDVSAAP
jgi:predicted kinase